jgi:hypothetical protein
MTSLYTLRTTSSLVTERDNPFPRSPLTLLEDGRIRYALKRPFGPCGALAIVLDQAALLHRLAALVPRPYLHLTRYSGIFAPNAARRHEVIPVSSARHPKHRRRPSAPNSVDKPSTPVVVGVDPPQQVFQTVRCSRGPSRTSRSRSMYRWRPR